LRVERWKQLERCKTQQNATNRRKNGHFINAYNIHSTHSIVKPYDDRSVRREIREKGGKWKRK
jgi:hypothetical protein